MPIEIKRAASPGGWATTDQVVVVKNGVWVGVQSAWVKHAAAPSGWAPLFQLYQAPPTGVRGVTADHNAATIAWNAAPQATQYQVVQRTNNSDASIYYYPWTTQLSWQISGMAQYTYYSFGVRARRVGAGGATYITSAESYPRPQIYSGNYQQLAISPGYPGTVAVNAPAISSNSWTFANKWASGGADVKQGYAGNAAASTNGFGTVYYGPNLYNTLVNHYGVTTANNTELVGVHIDHVYRKAGGTGTPTVYVYPSLLNYSDSRKPVETYPGTTFNPPAPNAGKDDFDFFDNTKLLNWARVWMNIRPGSSPPHNGLLMYRIDGQGNATSGYNGYLILRAANEAPADWRLVLQVRWYYVLVNETAPSWSTV